VNNENIWPLIRSCSQRDRETWALLCCKYKCIFYSTDAAQKALKELEGTDRTTDSDAARQDCFFPGTVESHWSVTYWCYRSCPGTKFIQPENSACNVPANNLLFPVTNYYSLPLSHQLANFPLAIMYSLCVHCNTAISLLHSATAADMTVWQVQ